MKIFIVIGIYGCYEDKETKIVSCFFQQRYSRKIP